MPYAVRGDLELTNQRLVELTDSAEAPGVINWDKVDRALARAATKIETPLRGKYVIPLNPVPDVARLWNVDIAKYLLYRNRETMEMPETVDDDYKRALAEIDRVANGNEGWQL